MVCLLSHSPQGRDDRDDILICCLDASLGFVWAKNFGDPTQQNAVAMDPAGNIAVTGDVKGPVSFGGAILHGSGTEPFVARFDRVGNYLAAALLSRGAWGWAIAAPTTLDVIVGGGFDWSTGFLARLTP